MGPRWGNGSSEQRLLRRVRGATDRSAGIRRVVGGPAPDVELSRAFPGGVLRAPRDAGADAGDRAGVPSRAAPPATSRRSRPPGASSCGCALPCRASSAMPTHVLVKPRGGEAERFDEVVMATHSDQALAHARRRRASASTRSSGRCPISATRQCCTPTRGCCPAAGAPGRAGTTTCSMSPPGCATVTYHMNRLQSLRAEQELCVTLNRTEAIDPAKVIRTIPYAHPVYTPPAYAPSGAAPRSVGATAPTTAAPTGAGAFTRTACERARRRRAVRGAAVSASALYEGTVRHRRFAVRGHEFRYGLALVYSISTSSPVCSAGACSRADPGSCASAGATIWATSSMPLADAVRDTVAGAGRHAAARADPAALTHLRTCGHCFNPVSFYYCMDEAARRESWRRGRRGHEYALGRAPRLRARACSEDCSLAKTAGRCPPAFGRRRCTSRRSWGWTSATSGV